MSEMQNVMIDIETLGSSPGAAILSIGAVEFDPHSDAIGHEFYEVIDLGSCVRAGLRIEPETVRWWMQQGDAARQAVFGVEGDDLRDVLSLFRVWRDTWKSTLVWAHGATFDPVLLDVAAQAVGKRPPWSYRNVRDTRTLFALAPGYTPDTVRAVIDGGVEHHALDDAKVQVRWVQRAFALLRGEGR